jgi:hypothetical protein
LDRKVELVVVVVGKGLARLLADDDEDDPFSSVFFGDNVTSFGRGAFFHRSRRLWNEASACLVAGEEESSLAMVLRFSVPRDKR